MPIYDDIREAFDSALNGVSGLPSIFYENSGQEADSETPHLTTNMFFTSRRPAVRGPDPQNRYEGIYRVTVCIPKRSGTGAALRYAETITNAFDGSSDIVGATKTVSVDYAELAPPFEQEPFYCLPVDISWYIYDQ